jgi:hypothetical protein
MRRHCVTSIFVKIANFGNHLFHLCFQRLSLVESIVWGISSPPKTLPLPLSSSSSATSGHSPPSFTLHTSSPSLSSFLPSSLSFYSYYSCRCVFLLRGECEDNISLPQVYFMPRTHRLVGEGDAHRHTLRYPLMGVTDCLNHVAQCVTRDECRLWEFENISVRDN